MEKSYNLFVIIIGAMFFLLGVYYWIVPKITIKNPKSAEGVIISTDTAVSEQMKKNNSKWALVEIDIDGKKYISSKKLQVSMDNKVGDVIEVIYDEENPENMVVKKRNHITFKNMVVKKKKPHNLYACFYGNYTYNIWALFK